MKNEEQVCHIIKSIKKGKDDVSLKDARYLLNPPHSTISMFNLFIPTSLKG